MRLRAASHAVSMPRSQPSLLDDLHCGRFARTVGLPADADSVERHFPERARTDSTASRCRSGPADPGLGIIPPQLLRHWPRAPPGKRRTAPVVSGADVSPEAPSYRAATDRVDATPPRPRASSKSIIRLPFTPTSSSAVFSARGSAALAAQCGAWSSTALCGALPGSGLSLAQQSSRQAQPRHPAVLG